MLENWSVRRRCGILHRGWCKNGERIGEVGNGWKGCVDGFGQWFREVRKD